LRELWGILKLTGTTRGYCDSAAGYIGTTVAFGDTAVVSACPG